MGICIKIEAEFCVEMFNRFKLHKYYTVTICVLYTLHRVDNMNENSSRARESMA